jgi:hypothetical protein
MLKIKNKIPSALTIGGKIVERVLMNNEVVWGKVQPDYFYIENIYAGTNIISLEDNQEVLNPFSNLQYSFDKVNWTSFTTSTTALDISLNQGEKLYIRGDENLGCVRLKISGSNMHNVGGNINTLINYNSPNNVVLYSTAFKSLFRDDIKLTSASNLILPATTLAIACYASMFQGCTSLTSTPELPATTLAQTCYQFMFRGCTSLTSTPILSATTLANDCYRYMFSDCTSLVNVSSLPATTLKKYCYEGMFQGCTSLTSTPVLPATTLEVQCYQRMFNGCSSLTSVTIYATTTASGAFFSWLNDVAVSGTVNNNGLLDLPESESGIPTGWTEVYPIQDIVADPDTFILKSYKTNVRCESTLTITTTLGTTVTKTNSAIVTVGENTGDSTRTLTETIPYKGSSYQVTIVQTANDVKPVVSWNVVSTGTYPFQLNSNDYYESGNKGVHKSYSYATLNYEGFDELVLECISCTAGEASYDYGIISQPDVQLSESYSDDGATGSANVFHNFKGESSTNPVQLTIPSDGGSHFITIKFIKDHSTSAGNDSLQFKVIEP